ncbi:MAG: NAD(P)/FAD-dependent oxidoreductase [Planctomycetaceae bacterium]
MGELRGEWDVAVLGAGAAGLLSAARLAERGLRTLLLEKNRRPGVKILMSGGTRCNLTHDTTPRGIAEAYGAQGAFLRAPLAALGPSELVALFHAEGVATQVEPGGKVFPQSNRAADVLAALLRRVQRTTCRLETEVTVTGLRPVATGWEVQTATGPVAARQVLVSVGGASYPGSGTTGDGYGWLRGLGHTIVSPRPALVPLLSEAGWVRALAGVTLERVGVALQTARGASGSGRRERRLAPSRCGWPAGGFLFTHRGISGPAVLNLSREYTALPNDEPAEVLCNFLPDLEEGELRELLRQRMEGGGARPAQRLLEGLLPQRVADTLCQLAGIVETTRIAELPKRSRDALLTQLRQCALPVRGTAGMAKAEVTAGGVALDEVDSRTMASRRCPGLYLAGEILDLDGPIGGDNFQAAFSTGWLAAERMEAHANP